MSGCASKRDVLKLAKIRYVNPILIRRGGGRLGPPIGFASSKNFHDYLRPWVPSSFALLVHKGINFRNSRTVSSLLQIRWQLSNRYCCDAKGWIAWRRHLFTMYYTTGESELWGRGVERLPPPTVFWMGFYADISWESWCSSEIKVWVNFCQILVVFEVPARPQVKRVVRKLLKLPKFDKGYSNLASFLEFTR